jgi:UDP-N-acetylglucosamine--N-acetylmuramyl-(pentapeptide) pyrophosphoryl-undecaprenol N-acetylglucosamine transferase
MAMKVALCGGGTGGHVYPALTIAAALQEEIDAGDRPELLYFGTASGQERRLVEEARIPFQVVPAGPIRGRSPLKTAKGALKMGRGVFKARHVLGRFAPQVVLATGGYASFPVALAARSKGFRLIVYLPDVYPGWAVQVMARLAHRVAISTDRSLGRLPRGKAVVTGYPVRPAFWQVEKTAGRQKLGLDREAKVLLVAGASQGAHNINLTLAANLRGLLELCEVVHLSGPGDEPELRRLRDGLSLGLRSRYHLFTYLHQEMPWAMAAADLALCRAGASVLGELPAVGLPALLIPYPYAGGHQRHNAAYLAENDAAIILNNGDLQRRLLPLVGELLRNDQRLQAMAAAARRLARPDAARNIARLMLEAATVP